jgi:hypothetical protein
MRNRLIFTCVTMIALSLLCCLLTGVFLEGSLLPRKPCRPVLYPNGNRTTESLDYAVTDSFDMVVSYYNDQLNAQTPDLVDTGQWSLERLSVSTFLYSCRGVDINGLTTETGCIFVSREASSTRIRTQLWRSEGGHIPCQP